MLLDWGKMRQWIWSALRSLKCDTRTQNLWFACQGWYCQCSLAPPSHHHYHPSNCPHHLPTYLSVYLSISVSLSQWVITLNFQFCQRLTYFTNLFKEPAFYWIDHLFDIFLFNSFVFFIICCLTFSLDLLFVPFIIYWIGFISS